MMDGGGYVSRNYPFTSIRSCRRSPLLSAPILLLSYIIIIVFDGLYVGRYV